MDIAALQSEIDEVSVILYQNREQEALRAAGELFGFPGGGPGDSLPEGDGEPPSGPGAGPGAPFPSLPPHLGAAGKAEGGAQKRKPLQRSDSMPGGRPRRLRALLAGLPPAAGPYHRPFPPGAAGGALCLHRPSRQGAGDAPGGGAGGKPPPPFGLRGG